MGKKSRIKKERQEQRQKDSNRQPNGLIDKNVRRRRFLYAAGATAVGMTIAGTICNLFREDKWDFIKAEPKSSAWLESHSSGQLMTQFPILGPEEIVNTGSPVLQDMKAWEPQIQQMMKERGLSPDIGYEVRPIEKMFGVPASQEVSAHYLDYCKKAKDFLYSNLNGLKELGIRWARLKDNDNFRDDFNHRAFIGDTRYMLYKVKVFALDDRDKDIFHLGRFRKEDGSTVSSRFTEGTNDLEHWFIFFGVGNTAVNAPISELIHTLLLERGHEHSFEAGYMRQHQAGENIAEGISYILSKRIAKELGIPNGVEIIEKTYKGLDNVVYKSLPAAIRWIEKNGVQNAYDLYIESPERFMQVVEKS